MFSAFLSFALFVPSDWQDFLYYEVCSQDFFCYRMNFREYPEPLNSIEDWPEHFPVADFWWNGDTNVNDDGVEICCTTTGACYPKPAVGCGAGTVATLCKSGTTWPPPPPGGSVTCWDFT